MVGQYLPQTNKKCYSILQCPMRFFLLDFHRSKHTLCVCHWKHCPSGLPNLLTCLVFSSFLYLISIMFALTKFLNSQPTIKWLHQSQWLIFKWHQQTVQPLFRYQCNIEINKARFPKKVKPPSISFRFKLFLASSSLHLTSLKVWAAVW